MVDDTFLGYVRLSELQSMMDQFAEITLSAPDSKAARVFPMLVAECLACREPGLINTGIDFLAFDAAWNDSQVLQEALSVGQDPDCRGKVCGHGVPAFHSQNRSRGQYDTVSGSNAGCSVTQQLHFWAVSPIKHASRMLPACCISLLSKGTVETRLCPFWSMSGPCVSSSTARCEIWLATFI